MVWIGPIAEFEAGVALSAPKNDTGSATDCHFCPFQTAQIEAPSDLSCRIADEGGERRGVLVLIGGGALMRQSVDLHENEFFDAIDRLQLAKPDRSLVDVWLLYGDVQRWRDFFVGGSRIWRFDRRLGLIRGPVAAKEPVGSG